MKRAALLSVLFAVYIAASAQCTSTRYTAPVFPAVTTTSGIYFGTANTYLGIPQDLYLDLYVPAGDTLTHRPLIVYAFGGGFLIGTRNQPPIPDYCTFMAQCGYVVASIDYRIGFNVADANSAIRAVYRGVQDLRGAVRFLCQNASQYGIDTSAIFLTGSSAGCFSGLHSCFMEQSDAPAAVNGTLLEPTNLGCLDCDDNADNNRTMPEIRGIISHWGAILDTNFIRGTVKDNVPVICLQGDQDNIVPYVSGPPFSVPIFPDVYGSVPICTRMTGLRIANKLHTFVGYGHEPWLLAPQLLDTCRVYEVPFLYNILKPKPLRITGDTGLCLNYAATYSITPKTGSNYCWTVAGGTILSDSNDHISILCTTAGRHLMTAQELTRDQVNGDLDSLWVDVVGHPVAAFGDSVLHTQATFSDSSIGATSWLYHFGDGSNATTSSPMHSYRSQDSFMVSLIVGNGYCRDTAYRLVRTDTCPAAMTISYLISGDTVYLSAGPAGYTGYSWRLGDGDTADVANPVHTYSRSQSYLVSLWTTTANGCSVYGSVIVPFIYKALGINDPTMDALKVYPNPADDLIHIEAGHDCHAILYDMSGKIVIQTEVQKDQHTPIDMSGLSPGFYVIHLLGNGTNAYMKIIKR